MEQVLNFKFGSTLDGKSIAEGDFIAINKGMASDASETDKKYGSLYKGDKILGTTEADKLYTTDEIIVTGVTVGNLTNGKKIDAGTDVMSLLTQMLMKELGVSASKPTASITGGSNGTYEKGTVISGKTYTASLTDGKYTGENGYSYSLNAGCSATDCTWSGVTGTKNQNGNTYSIVADSIALMDTVTIKATISYSDATNVPVTNFGNAIVSGLISAGSASTLTITYTPSLK